MEQTRRYLVNRNIRHFIDTLDKRPTAIADKAGIRRDIFSRILHCRRPVYADEVVPIASAMGLQIEDLFAENGEPQANVSA